MTDKEKLKEIKKLADAMYYTAFNLTTDASLLRKAMKEYHQFIIHEYRKEEPVSESIDFEQELYKAFGQIKDFTLGIAIAKRFYDMGRKYNEPVSEDMEEDINKEWRCYSKDNDVACINKFSFILIARHFANWQKSNLWKPADGDDLPEIDREVIAILDNGKVVFAHRPPEYWDGKDIITGKVTRNYPKTYDKGGWNIPNVKWWLDCSLPNMEED